MVFRIVDSVTSVVSTAMRMVNVGVLLGFVTSVAAGGSRTGALQAEDTPGAYAVSYLEVRRSAANDAIEALRGYREASRTEPGWIGVELLAQIGRPGHFATVERWASQSALDAHDQAASTRQLADKLEPIRASEYDRRPYKALTVATRAAQAGADAVVVVSHVDTLPSPQSDAAGLLKQLAERSRRDAGNLLFDVVQHAARANHFTVIEIWRDSAAQQTHAETPYVRDYRERFKAMLGSPLDERLFTIIR